ncbi:4-hydroxy-2-oxoheptanedioate aldolase [Aquabacterium sp. J223]|uniref:4-hydroxy-2-oxoheptanedioate aldolase n=1 Tax=Aquabacterium sp. J223 TaxID=2898431 RepID=UPI0021ADDED6|nr:4-hydroxy-2-oxoheptanedioate aldolase [Aquabacterium sp. J223]UUX97104.1 4-hydroxy-2-oxoheptanedioate aldolase [Aquabacterium sp. J223]
MRMPLNAFKQALREGRPQIGLWVGLADPYVAELLATTGYDWLLIDGEHAPNDLRSVLAQLQAVAPYGSHPIVRPPIGDTALIKQILDTGAQTLLVPMVESAQQAAQVVAATRYPPRGVRGVGSALARSSRWNRIDGYLHAADDQMCVLVQVESAQALSQVSAIAAVDGVDGVFFGPADLSASMGLLGQPGHPDVQQAITGGIAAVRQAGKAAGILTADAPLAKHYLSLGALFVAVGVDTMLLARAASAQLALFKGQDEPPPPAKGSVY